MALFLRPSPPASREEAVRAYKGYRTAKEVEIRAANTRTWITAWNACLDKAEAADAVMRRTGLTWRQILHPDKFPSQDK